MFTASDLLALLFVAVAGVAEVIVPVLELDMVLLVPPDRVPVRVVSEEDVDRVTEVAIPDDVLSGELPMIPEHSPVDITLVGSARLARVGVMSGFLINTGGVAGRALQF